MTWRFSDFCRVEFVVVDVASSIARDINTLPNRSRAEQEMSALAMEGETSTKTNSTRQTFENQHLVRWGFVFANVNTKKSIKLNTFLIVGASGCQ